MRQPSPVQAGVRSTTWDCSIVTNNSQVFSSHGVRYDVKCAGDASIERVTEQGTNVPPNDRNQCVSSVVLCNA